MAKILIIEDDQVLAQIYATRLATEGHTVLTENNGQLGVQKAKEEKPDIILLDLMLPQLTGQQVLLELKKPDAIPQIPVIVLSNLASPLEEQEALNRGASKYLVKTKVTPSEVLATISQVLKQDKADNTQP